MKAEIIAVGTELLLGNIVNTNAQFLSKELAALGYDMFYQSVVGDNFDRATATISEAVKRSDVVLITGGLGPTPDDLSKEAAAKALGLELYLNEECLKQIENYFAKSGRKMSENNRKQAMFPKERCVIFQNKNGTAPGCAMTAENGSVVILMPGVPREMKMMFELSIKPYLAQKSNKTIYSENVLVVGIGESMLTSLIPEFIDNQDPTVSPYCKTGMVTLRVTSSAKTETEAKEKCDKTVSELKTIFGKNVCGVDVSNIETVVVNLLKEKRLHLATAESCTGGMLSKAITSVPGASAVFDFGATTYSNEMKQKLLMVDAEIIKNFGAVSAETAVNMAKGIMSFANADIGVSITGVAGPGCSENKPVGLVYIALADKESVWVMKLNVTGAENDRDKVRESSTVHALDMIRRYLTYLPNKMPNGTDLINPIPYKPEETALNELSH